MSCPLLGRSQLAAAFYMAILTCPAEEQNKHHSTSNSSIIIANNDPIHQPRSQIYPCTVAISIHPKINWMYKHNIQMYPTFPMYIGYVPNFFTWLTGLPLPMSGSPTHQAPTLAPVKHALGHSSQARACTPGLGVWKRPWNLGLHMETS